MPLYVGLDVSQKETEICVVDEEGRHIWRGRCATRPESIRPGKGMRPSRLGSAWRRDRWRSGCGTACVLWNVPVDCSTPGTSPRQSRCRSTRRMRTTELSGPRRAFIGQRLMVLDRGERGAGRQQPLQVARQRAALAGLRTPWPRGGRPASAGYSVLAEAPFEHEAPPVAPGGAGEPQRMTRGSHPTAMPRPRQRADLDDGTIDDRDWFCPPLTAGITGSARRSAPPRSGSARQAGDRS
jgi:hypothetical protein